MVIKVEIHVHLDSFDGHENVIMFSAFGYVMMEKHGTTSPIEGSLCTQLHEAISGMQIACMVSALLSKTLFTVTLMLLLGGGALTVSLLLEHTCKCFQF